MRSTVLLLLFTLAVGGCGGGSLANSGSFTLPALHDVYEATNVALPEGYGNGSILFAFSENGVPGSEISGEVVLVSPSSMTRWTIYSGKVTRTGSTATFQGESVNAYVNRTLSVSGSFSSSTFTYALGSSSTASGTAARVASYVDNNETFVPPSGFIGTLSYVPTNTSCANGTVYVTISGAQADGYGLWRPLGAVAIATPPSLPYGQNDGVWDGNDVFVLIDLLNTTNSGPTLSITLTAFPAAGANGGMAQFGATPCTTPVTP